MEINFSQLCISARYLTHAFDVPPAWLQSHPMNRIETLGGVINLTKVTDFRLG